MPIRKYPTWSDACQWTTLLSTYGTYNSPIGSPCLAGLLSRYDNANSSVLNNTCYSILKFIFKTVSMNACLSDKQQVYHKGKTSRCRPVLSAHAVK